MSQLKIIDEFEKPQMTDTVPHLEPGYTVRVHNRIVEGDKERIQQFQGLVIAVRGVGARAMFTVRKVSFGIGVERAFPFHSPRVVKVEVLNKAHVRRAKLYYLRDLRGKASRLREKNRADVVRNPAAE